jgi:hypothetical protein
MLTCEFIFAPEPGKSAYAKLALKSHYQWVNAGDMPYYRIPLIQKDECIGFVMFFLQDAFLLNVEEGLFHKRQKLLPFI